MIVRLVADGAVVQDADDCTRLHVETDLDADGVRTALVGTGTGELIDADHARLDLGVLRARARLAATAPGWDASWAAMTAAIEREGRLSADGRAVHAQIEH